MKMNGKMRLFGLLFVFLAGALFGSVSVSESDVRIYLPREVQIEREQVTLSEICAIRGSSDVMDRAGRINLGRLSMPLQEMTISRAMILGRLTSNGFEASSVEFTGADKVLVTQRRQIIRGVRIKERAESFLKGNIQDKSVCKFEVMGGVADLTLPDEAKNIELLLELVSRNSNRVKVNITVLADGKTVGQREVEFRLRYFCREAVALRDIAPGEVITKENVKVTQKISSSTESSDWQMPYGQVARRRIAASSVITPGSAGPMERKVLVRRNKHVAVVFEQPGLSITAVGKALEDGRAGDYIKVRMQITNSTRIIYARVNDNGTVEPLI